MSISQDAQERINQYAKKRVVSTLINDMVSEAPAPQESIQSTGNTDDTSLADNTIHTDNTGHTHTAVNTHNAGYTHNAGHTHYTGRETEGLIYGGFIIIGIAAGALSGYFCGGGHKKFLSGGWADTFAGSMAGLMIGIGLGKIVNAVLHITCNK
ncbi:hypothetical protein DWX59_04705 [Enterocloster aldenensis]|uniref:hypothetical protein n=1 Tax=Enterocloster aldenensis TaxID=358742 RepID=UPI000E3FE9B9|nr:hypothetical protein DWX59_04705 [Enterocloster aldenensis]